MEYFTHVAIVVLIFALLAESLDLLVGYSGQLSLGHAVFFGAGGYSAAILSTHYTSNFLLLLLCSTVVASGLGFLFALLSMRLSRNEFAIATFAVQGIFVSIMTNIDAVGGARGITDIPDLTLGSMIFVSRAHYLVLAFLLVLIVTFGLRLLIRSRLGLVFRALRNDELLVASYGHSLFSVKILLFVTSAAVAGLAGVVFAHYFKFVEPHSFTVGESFLMLLMVGIGGGGNLLWAIGGALTLIAFPELLRFMNIPITVAAELRQIVFASGRLRCLA